MITKLKTLLYIASDNSEHRTLELCIRHELTSLLGELKVIEEVIDTLLKERERVVDILSTTGASKPKLRKINKKARMPKVAEKEAA